MGISTHAPAGGATYSDYYPVAVEFDFYSRPCGRGDNTRRSTSSRTSGPFLLTPLREGRQDSMRTNLAVETFLLTPLREGRPRSANARGRFAHNFYSRPCGRGDQEALNQCFRFIISTHAPAGGATALAPHPPASGRISTHAPAGGATHSLHIRLRPVGISTHAPAGGATATTQEAHLAEIISTHAPAGGATTIGQQREILCCYFYSRPCGRGDSNFPQVRHEVLRQIAER